MMARGVVHSTARARTLQVCAAFVLATGVVHAASRPPIVIVPGAPGTELVDRVSGERIWPNARLMSIRHGTDRLALPFDDPESTSIVAGGLLREVHVAGMKFRVRVYDGLEKKLRAKGYREGDWNAPTGDGEYFYFAYDWRQSFETSGRRLFDQLVELYRRSPPGTPRAIVLGHSLGGLVARYALMYGNARLGTSGPLPPVSWAGSELMETLFLVATPNEGTFLALKRLDKGIFYHGHRGAFSPETLFTYPSIFDMIPEHPAPLIDADGNALPFNMDDPKDWERLRWSVIDPRRGSSIPYAVRRAHLESELGRSGRLWSAMGQLASTPNPVPIHAIACLSHSVQRTALVTPGNDGMKVSFGPSASNRMKLRALLFEPGDEMVPMRSLVASGSSHDPAGSLCFSSVVRSRRSHHQLLSSPEMLAALDRLLK